jgi:hypothetical protein
MNYIKLRLGSGFNVDILDNFINFDKTAHRCGILFGTGPRA